jgi:cobalt-precorrin-5B (C1)-methyltransferase
LSAAISTANTARHVQELVENAGLGAFFQQVCHLAATNCKAQAAEKLTIEIIMFDFEGRVLGRVEI